MRQSLLKKLTESDSTLLWPPVVKQPKYLTMFTESWRGVSIHSGQQHSLTHKITSETKNVSKQLTTKCK